MLQGQPLRSPNVVEVNSRFATTHKPRSLQSEIYINIICVCVCHEDGSFIDHPSRVLPILPIRPISSNSNRFEHVTNLESLESLKSLD